MAFYATIAVFPLLASVAALLTALVSPAQLKSITHAVHQLLPQEVGSLVVSQLSQFSGREHGNLAISLLAVAITLGAATNAVQNLIQAANKSFNVAEHRSPARLLLTSLVLAVAGLTGMLLVLAVVFIAPQAARFQAGPSWLFYGLLIARWLALFGLIAVSLAVFYRFGPANGAPRWRLISWGATATALIWLIGTAAFYWYVQYAADYTLAYGGFAGLAILMLWLNFSALVFLLGAEITRR